MVYSVAQLYLGATVVCRKPVVPHWDRSGLHLLTTRHHSHFAGARSLHQALTQEPRHWCWFSEAHLVQAFLCKLTILKRRVATFSRITITEVSFLHCGRGLHIPIQQLVPPLHNRDVLLPNLDRTRQPSLQAQAGDSISEVQNFSGLEKVVSCPRFRN